MFREVTLQQLKVGSIAIGLDVYQSTDKSLCLKGEVDGVPHLVFYNRSGYSDKGRCFTAVLLPELECGRMTEPWLVATRSELELVQSSLAYREPTSGCVVVDQDGLAIAFESQHFPNSLSRWMISINTGRIARLDGSKVWTADWRLVAWRWEDDTAPVELY